MPAKCKVHDIDAQVCGGPHRYVETDIGNELLGPGKEPVGTPVKEMTAADRKSHREAVKKSKEVPE